MTLSRLAVTLSIALATLPLLAAEMPLEEYSLEDLLSLEVTSVSRKEERLFKAASAVDVITQEDIRRSGAVVLPQLLENGVGIHAAQDTGPTWAITARGMNAVGANKMEVLMDGRSLYTPLYSGVFWDIQDTLFDNLDRIEIIRGPGATMWGANAVNGVINIYTKPAQETQGLLVQGAAGNNYIRLGGARYGFMASENTAVRIYGKYFHLDEVRFPSEERSPFDVWEMGRLGFRTDTNLTGDSTLTLAGEIHATDLGIISESYAQAHGGHFRMSYQHKMDDGGSLEIRSFLEDGYWYLPQGYEEDRRTWELSAQHNVLPWAGHDVMWGAGYRRSSDQTYQVAPDPYFLGFVPASKTVDIFNIFVQDRITVADGKLQLIPGVKFEHNSFSQWEVQPSIRAQWSLSSNQSVWGAVSRAVRMPARIDEDFRIASPGLAVLGNPDYKAEELIAYELGYRHQITTNLMVDVATFYNVYDHLRTMEPMEGLPGFFIFDNLTYGETYGAELHIGYRPSYWLFLELAGTWLSKDLKVYAQSQDPSAVDTAGNDPDYLLSFSARFDLPKAVELDLKLNYTESLPLPYIPAYLGLDARLSWAPTENVELELVGRDLLDSQHPEFNASSPFQRQIARSVYAQVTLRY